MGLIGFVFGKIQSVYDFYRYLTNLPLIVALGAAHQAKSTIFATITFGAFLLVITWLSIFTYISAYYYFLPTLLHTKDVNLQYRSVKVWWLLLNRTRRMKYISIDSLCTTKTRHCYYAHHLFMSCILTSLLCLCYYFLCSRNQL